MALLHSNAQPMIQPQERSSAPLQPRVDSRELLQGMRELVIRHGDQEYRLRHTQNDKLILTK